MSALARLCLAPIFVSTNVALHSVQHPSSDLASLGHLLPQGEKVELAICRLSKSSTLAIGRGAETWLLLLPLGASVRTQVLRWLVKGEVVVVEKA